MPAKPEKKRTPECELWDPLLLYQLAVQDPVSPTIHLMRQVFQQQCKRRPRSLREDFCGTALLSFEWLRMHGAHLATGIDIDPKPLAWAREHFLPQISTEQASRIALLEEDVRTSRPTPHDIICAFNFSYMLLSTRENLRNYFAQVREGLVEDGVFFLDLFGGSEAITALEEETEVEFDATGTDSPLLGELIGARTAQFTYVWEQRSFNPVDHQMTCAIHFAFPDGSAQRDAFTYTWRLWSIPEIRELLAEAGFKRTEVHWQVNDEDGHFTGYEQTEVMDDDPCWIAFLAAFR